MDIDSGTRGLDQSCHHLSGLGGTNVEAVTPKVITARERVPKHLSRLRKDSQLGTIFSAGGRVEAVPRHARSGSDTRQKRVRRAAAPSAQQQHRHRREPGQIGRKGSLEGPSSSSHGRGYMGVHRRERRYRSSGTSQSPAHGGPPLSCCQHTLDASQVGLPKPTAGIRQFPDR
ncbi:hypothetical protein E4U58_006722 [Claviceps cyperi]|nr:hypothetical protein E4U58_006722 [Claviceps cyperi]